VIGAIIMVIVTLVGGIMLMGLLLLGTIFVGWYFVKSAKEQDLQQEMEKVAASQTDHKCGECNYFRRWRVQSEVGRLLRMGCTLIQSKKLPDGRWTENFCKSTPACPKFKEKFVIYE